MAALEQLYGEAQCRQIAGSMQTSMGMQPGAPVEGRAIVEWMLANDSAACIDITTSTEASLVGTLFLEMGIIAPVDEGVMVEMFQNERRRYCFRAPGEPNTRARVRMGAAAAGGGRGGGGRGGGSGVERRSEPELDGRSVLSVDPTALLQLPPKRLSARLEALGRRLEESLEPVGVFEAPGDAGKAKHGPPPKSYTCASAVEFMITHGVCDTAAQAVMLGNLLVNLGCVVLIENLLEEMGRDAGAGLAATSLTSMKSERSTRSTGGLEVIPTRFEDDPKLEFVFSGSVPTAKRISLTAQTIMLSGDGPEAAEEAQKLTLAVQGLTSKGAKEARAKRTAEAASAAEAAELEELALLEAMVAKEEAALKSEQQQLAEDTKALLALQAKTREASATQKKENADLNEERDELLRQRFLVEARQVKLLSELQSIYPIQEEGDGFAIRGLDLPYNYEAKDDEVVSSALGYVTHLMLMLSKYLQIPLRYQLVYSASRSAVRDRVAPGRDTPSPTSNIYPLYRRGVDNARFVTAIEFLQANVRQVLTVRGVHYDDKAHMLKNLNELFKSEIIPELM